MSGSIELVEGVHERRDVHEPLGGELLDLGEEAVLRDASDHGVELLAELAGEVNENLQLNEFAFGGLGSALHLRTVFAEGREFGQIGGGFLVFDPAAEQAMHNQVWITANRRREVAIVLAG